MTVGGEGVNNSTFRSDARAGIPAAVLGLTTVAILLGGLYCVPPRLEANYSGRLAAGRAEYQAAIENDASAAELNHLASQLDIVFSRMVEIDGGSPARYWEWAVFLDEHASNLVQSAAPETGDTRSDLANQPAVWAAEYRNNARKLLETLAAGKSEYSAGALLRLAELKLEQHFQGLAAMRDTQLGERLTNLLAGMPETQAESRDRAAGLLATLRLESGWGDSPAKEPAGSGDTKPGNRSMLILDRQVLDSVQDLYTTFGHNAESQVHPWRAIGAILRAYGEADEIPNAVSGSSLTAETLWQTRLAEVVLGAIDGDWNDVAFLLGRKNSDNPAAVRHGLARWVCRLSTSRLAVQDAPWREAYPVGMQLVSQIAPQLPEFNELLWRLASQNAGLVAESDSLIPAELVAAVAGAQSIPMRHSVLALSSILLDKPQVARSHLQLVQRAGGSLTVLSQTVLWAVNSTADGDQARLEGLAQMLTELEPDSGFHWFVLGVIEKRAGDYSAAETAFEKALALLGEIPAIEELLSAVRADAKRAEAEQAR